MTKKCEICGSELQWTLVDEYHPEVKYKVCSNCLIHLVNNALPSKSWKKLIKNGHNENEFILHGDFYDEEGNALQPIY